MNSQISDKLHINEEAVQALLDALGKGNVEQAEEALSALGARQESELFQMVGSMARSLHTSLVDFKKNLDAGNVTMTSTTIPDAADKLETVMKMTFEAAQTTMDLTEKQEELLESGKTQVNEMIAELNDQDELPKDFKAKLSGFLNAEQERIEEAQNIASSIVMAQTFQDLTGQALQKVIKLVTELEKDLVSLIKIFGTEQEQPSEQETASEETPESQKVDQEDVDSILSSFGF